METNIVDAADVAAPEPSMFDMPEWTGVFPPVATKSGPPERKLVGIRFQPVGKVYHYEAAGFNVNVKDWVIVDTVRGRQMGQVATLQPPKDKAGGGGPYKRIERMATGRDMAMRHFYENKELEAMIACRAESAGLQLPIKIVRAEYSFDGQTLTLLYSTDEEERVDTGALRDRMSHLYKSRIEMRQISPREVAKIIGGLGACGISERCCSRFLTEFSPISIKHAKEQNLSLNPHDITGMCGRLRCCLVYEYEQYVEAKRHLPKVKSVVGTPNGEGKVVEVNPMRDMIIVQFKDADNNKREMEFHREQIVPLEEWKRLQEKAASGSCDRHEGGGCDCGKKGPKTKIADANTEAGDQPVSPPAPPTAAQVFQQANETQQNEADAKARAEVVREKMKRRRDERDARRAQKPGQTGNRPSGPSSQARPQASAASFSQSSPSGDASPKREERGEGSNQSNQGSQGNELRRDKSRRPLEQRPNPPQRNAGGLGRANEPRNAADGSNVEPRGDSSNDTPPPDASNTPNTPNTPNTSANAQRRPPRRPLAPRKRSDEQ